MRRQAEKREAALQRQIDALVAENRLEKEKREREREQQALRAAMKEMKATADMRALSAEMKGRIRDLRVEMKEAKAADLKAVQRDIEKAAMRQDILLLQRDLAPRSSVDDDLGDGVRGDPQYLQFRDKRGDRVDSSGRNRDLHRAPMERASELRARATAKLNDCGVERVCDELGG